MQACLPECSVIIPVYNKWELTRDCLASLREHTAAHDLEVIVVDNGSTDETAAALAPYGKSLFGERFSAIVFPENKNFSPACNAGARQAASSLLLFLNNDTLLTPEWLPPLLSAIHKGPSSMAIGPLLLYKDDSVQHLGVTYGLLGPLHLYQNFPSDHQMVRRKRTLQAITGAAFMIRKEFFHECGGFYEKYRNGYEDLDLCVQIKQRGGILRCVTSSRVYHLESKTPGRKDFENFNNTLFARRCGKDIFVDIHHHALRDGFEVVLNDLLSIDIKHKQKDEDAITALAQGQDADVWLRLIRENPLWIQGRELLAQGFEQQQFYEDAVRLRLELATKERELSRYRDLLRLVPFIDTPPWLERLEFHMNLMKRLRTDYAFTLTVARERRRYFRQDGDTVLEQIFAAKLREWFPNVPNTDKSLSG